MIELTHTEDERRILLHKLKETDLPVRAVMRNKNGRLVRSTLRWFAPDTVWFAEIELGEEFIILQVMSEHALLVQLADGRKGYIATFGLCVLRPEQHINKQ